MLRLLSSLTVTAGLLAVSVACSSGDSGAEPVPDAPRVSVLDGGAGISLASAAGASGLPDGWTEEELALSGTATAYATRGALPEDGTFDLAPTLEDEYATRLVVRRPPGDAFNGTVVVEWLNVSGGLDASPDWTYLADELLRGGYAWVGVSAQHVGVEGGAVAVGTAASRAAGAGRGLRATDPERYGDLHHPGDAFSYDIYTQAAAAIRSGDVLGPLDAATVLAVGESQSAYALTTYANGVQPLTGAFDGFLVHSRGGAAAGLGGRGSGIDMAATVFGPPTRIRTDLEVPVLVLQTETDVVGLLNYLPARQPDTDLLRVWEVAGTAHADRYLLGPLADGLDCGAPINDGPHHLVAKAALRSLDRWVRDGVAPATGEPLAVRRGGYLRDRDGIVRGGIRTPLVDVPVDVLSGDSDSTEVACLLFGTTTPLPAARIAERYTGSEDYLAAYERSADAVVDAGFVLPEDRGALLAAARPGAVADAVRR